MEDFPTHIAPRMFGCLPLPAGVIHVTQQSRSPEQEHRTPRWRLQSLDPCADFEGVVRMVETIETVHSATIAKVATKGHRTLKLTRRESHFRLRWCKDDLPKRYDALFYREFGVQRQGSRAWNWGDFDRRSLFGQRRRKGQELHGSHAGTLASERKACDTRINGHEHFLGSRSPWRTFWGRHSGTH